MNALGNIKIRAKALILIAITVLTAAIMFIVSSIGLSSLKTSLDQLVLATNVERYAYETILQEKNYLLNANASTGNAKLAEQAFRTAEKDVTVITDTLDRIDTFDNPRLLERSKAARQGTAAYADLYRQGVAALVELDKLSQALEVDGETATQQAGTYMKSINDPRKERIAADIRRYAYQIRLNEKRYMADHRPETFDAMKQDFAAMMQLLATLERDAVTEAERSQVATFKQAALGYEKAAYKWVERDKQLFDVILPKMKELGDQVIKLAYDAAAVLSMAGRARVWG
jgi:methyl-accepting chemotaxis protein